jgi:hypothetical protein
MTNQESVMNTTIETVTSADGTPIAIEQTGRGAPVILIGGAFNDRSTMAALAGTLAPYVTAVAYTGVAAVTAETAVAPVPAAAGAAPLSSGRWRTLPP